MEKIYINDLAKVSNVTHAIGIDAGGNTVLIGKSNLAADIANYIPATKGEVWIAYLDNLNRIALIPWDQWSTSRTDAAGIAIISGGRRLVIAPHEALLRWGSTTGSGGAVTATTKEAADIDYAGKSNTGKITTSAAFSGDGEGYAPGYCAAYSNGGVTAGSWWLPSLGELGLIYEKLDAINVALAKISGATQIPTIGHWASTENSETSAWVMGISTGTRGTYSKTNNEFRARPVTTF